MNFRISLFICAITFFISCKKSEDTERPAIQIISPVNPTSVNVFDTLHVKIHVSDNIQLESMNVRLVTTSLIGVLPSVSIPVSGKNYDADFYYVIDNYRLTSDNYYLSVDVSDGTNLSRAYCNIYVTGIPKRLNGFFAATIPAPGTLNIYKGDTSWSASLFNSFPSDFTDMAVNNYWQQVITDGIYTGPLKAMSIDGSTTGYSLQSISGPSPYWGILSVKDSRLWVSYKANAFIKSINQNGVVDLSLNTDLNYFPYLNLQSGNYVFSEQRDISGANPKIVVYSTSGAGLHETTIPFNPICMFERNADEMYVIGNNAGQGYLMIYDNTTNGFYTPIGLPAATVNCATQIDSNTIVLGMSNGNLYRFTYNPIGLLNWASGINPNVLRYDEVNDEIYTAEGSNVNVYSYNPFALLHTIPIPETISDLELWYNK
ncbi:hypothetical protein BH09BAC5_BH09BAC5_24160 [soil metagenome]